MKEIGVKGQKKLLNAKVLIIGAGGPFREDAENPNSIMEIGYVTKKNSMLSKMGEEYIEELNRYLSHVQTDIM